MVYEGCEWDHMAPSPSPSSRRHSAHAAPSASADKQRQQRRCSQDFLINDESECKYQVLAGLVVLLS